MLRISLIPTLVTLTIATTGCSSMPPLVVGAIPTLPTAPSLKGVSVYDDPPAELYVRIARGANTCWFGREGSLKATHIFHADLDPPDKGAGAEIVIYERDLNAEVGTNPRSLRAMRVLISRTDGKTQVDAQPLRIPPDIGIRLADDVHRWASGNTSCAITASVAPLSSTPPPPVAAAPIKSARPTSTTATK